MRSVEIFTGAGGLALGLQRAGFEPVLMVERDDHAYATLRENSRQGGPAQDWPVLHIDIREVSFYNRGNVDLVAGGPPCQPFSIAGKHRGPDDPRDMWPQAIRAVRETAPKVFLFENVRGLTRKAFAKYLSYIVERLQRPAMAARPSETWQAHLARLARLPIGEGDGPLYRVEVHHVNAADYGVPQKRHRVVIIGLRLDLDLDWTFPKPSYSRQALLQSQLPHGSYWKRHGIHPKRSSDQLDLVIPATLLAQQPWRTVRDAIADLPDPRSPEARDIPNHCFQPGARSYAGHTGSPLDEPAKALKAGDHGVPGGENMLLTDSGRIRYFTVRESARLQGFPDNFVFPCSWTESMRQLGNAVPVPLAEAIASSLAAALRRASREQRAA